MAWIALEKMKFFAYHGVHPEEQKTGGEFVVDIHVKTDIKRAAQADDIHKTIDYEVVYRLCKREMEKPQKLIETVSANIISQMKRRFITMEALRLKIHKLSPPLGGRVGASSIEIEEVYEQACGRCQSQKLSCYHSEDCWCKQVKVHPTTRQSIRGEYKKCLCAECLNLYAG